jgi:glutaredoxin
VFGRADCGNHVQRRWWSVRFVSHRSFFSADVYKWKDANGRTHVSDSPPADYQAERLRIRHFTPSGGTTQDEDAVAASSVVMLSASWCEVCKRARSWLTQNGIAFTEYDVERDPKGKEEYKRRGGKGVPIILFGDQRMDGFNTARLEAMLAKARK